MMPAPAGMGIPTKYLRPARPGFLGSGFLLILKRANRAAPLIRNRKQTIPPKWINRSSNRSLADSEMKRENPQRYASRAGATPKVMTSARESSSLPKSDVVLVIRAIRPSSPSKRIANPISIAELSKCCGFCIEPRIACRMAKKPAAMLPQVKSDGRTYSPRRPRRFRGSSVTRRRGSPFTPLLRPRAQNLIPKLRRRLDLQP